ncbi:hypothetical protein [Arcticibacter tournemirensis]
MKILLITLIVVFLDVSLAAQTVAKTTWNTDLSDFLAISEIKEPEVIAVLKDYGENMHQLLGGQIANVSELRRKTKGLTEVRRKKLLDLLTVDQLNKLEKYLHWQYINWIVIIVEQSKSTKTRLDSEAQSRINIR